MAQLDAMLRALQERGAQELVLGDGLQPVFRFPEGDRPVSKAVLRRAQIVTLLSELSGTEEGAEMGAGRPVRFVYRMEDGRIFEVHAGLEGGVFAARVVARAAEPADSPAVAAPTASPAPATAITSNEGTKEIDAFLTRMVEAGGSDLHLSSCEVPMLRIDGSMVRMEGTPAQTPADVERLLNPITPEPQRREFAASRDADFAYEIKDLARFRVNVFADRNGTGAVFRVIPTKIPSAEDLGLPKVILDLCNLSKGLVLVTGPTGSGKSTTLAAMIDYINRSRSEHIITIEDPIEFVHQNRECLLNQREVGTHTEGFKTALRAALREDPDIVLVGELRDLETIAIAIETAETGHLVFGTLHTTTAPSTIDRIIDQFPSDQQEQIRTMLSDSLKGVIAQTLLKKIGGGRVAAMEILVGLPAIANLIREGKTFQIPSIMQTGKKHGMQQLNEALLDLVKNKVVEADEALRKAVDKAGLKAGLKAAGFRIADGSDAA